MTYSNGDVYDGIWHKDMVSELTNMVDVLTVTSSVTVRMADFEGHI